MRLLVAFALAALCVAPVSAQVFNPSAGAAPVDTSQFATKSDMQTVQTAASNAQTAASTAQTAVSTLAGQVVKTVNATTPDGSGNIALTIPTPTVIANQINAATTNLATTSAVSALAAQIPQPASSVPPAEIIGGAVGTAGTYRPGNSVQPRISRSVAFTTTSAGTATVTWADMGAVPLAFVVPNVASGATQAPMCYPVAGTITSTGATVKCFTTQSVTVSILGAVVAPLTTAGAGVAGQILALPAS